MFIKYFLFHTSFITIFFSVISLTAAQINPEIPKVGEKAPYFEFENFSSKKIVIENINDSYEIEGDLSNIKGPIDTNYLSIQTLLTKCFYLMTLKDQK